MSRNSINFEDKKMNKSIFYKNKKLKAFFTKTKNYLR